MRGASSTNLIRFDGSHPRLGCCWVHIWVHIPGNLRRAKLNVEPSDGFHDSSVLNRRARTVLRRCLRSQGTHLVASTAASGRLLRRSSLIPGSANLRSVDCWPLAITIAQSLGERLQWVTASGCDLLRVLSTLDNMSAVVLPMRTLCSRNCSGEIQWGQLDTLVHGERSRLPEASVAFGHSL